jgi:hypothetical protein
MPFEVNAELVSPAHFKASSTTRTAMTARKNFLFLSMPYEDYFNQSSMTTKGVGRPA